MAVKLNHTVIVTEDAETSARWFADLFDMEEPEPIGPFWQVTTANGVGLDFVSDADNEIFPQHYAFLVGEEDFDAIYRRIRSWDLEHWADPAQRHPGEINHNGGGRGVYFLSNDGHVFEILTHSDNGRGGE